MTAKTPRAGIVTCTITGTNYKCKKNFTCKSSNLVYTITCHTCKLQGHYSNITNALKNLRKIPQDSSPYLNLQIQGDIISQHFALATHKGTSDLNIEVVDFISLSPNSERALKLRLGKDKFWIHRLRCSVPQGLNIME